MLLFVMDIFAAVADPVRRDILALLANRPSPAGAVAEAFNSISRPAVSRHLRVLREAGLVCVQPRGRQQIYASRTEPLGEITEWIDGICPAIGHRLDALETEVYRTRREHTASDSSAQPRPAHEEHTA
ncbi:MAG: metalloregulator ArsR/SmtB family transcription factor [Ornithinimicrobium sp.]